MEISLYDELTILGNGDWFYIYDVSEKKHKKIKAENLVSSSIYLTGDLKFSVNNTPDAGWLICDGSAVPRMVYTDLFNVIGETYGAGDGVTTFNLPDFIGKVPVSVSDEEPFETEGNTGGNNTHQVTESEMAAHNHELESVMPMADAFWYAMGPVPLQIRQPMIMPPAWTGYTGGDQPHPNLMPYLTIGSIQIKI